MAILINGSKSGFRKWSEAQELRKLDDTRGEAVLAGGIASPDVGQEVMTPDQTPQGRVNCKRISTRCPLLGDTLVVAVIERDGVDSRALGPARKADGQSNDPAARSRVAETLRTSRVVRRARRAYVCQCRLPRGSAGSPERAIERRTCSPHRAEV